jgi:phosphatidylserine/phosphatidylglycerophosphate/cardiolipin synthase-like enzyme
MHILRNLILLSAVATAMLVFRHREEIQQYSHASLPSAFTWTESQFWTVRAAEGSDQIIFSPAQDIERVDIDLINNAHATIRVAMFAFTDRAIAQALARAAARGVQIWVYRDRDQFEQEDARHCQVMNALSGQTSIHVRVKGSKELMHEKAMLVDDSTLRDGSSNWSVSAARYQDNQVSITHDAKQIEAFSRDFTEMWARADNLIVQ